MNELREVARTLHGERRIYGYRISEIAHSHYLEFDAIFEITRGDMDASKRIRSAAENSQIPDGFTCGDFSITESSADEGRIYVAARYRKIS